MFHTSRFNQLTQAIPRHTFNKSVAKAQADRYAKKTKCWDLLMLLTYGHLHQVSSLRQLVQEYSAQDPFLYHLGSKSLKRSTVSDALAKRSDEPFRVLCEALLGQVARSQRKELKEVVCAIDSTPIKLPNPRFSSWTEGNQTPRCKGLKVHVASNLDTALPFYARITDPRINDINDAKTLTIMPNTTYVVDKGYTDYNWWRAIDEAGATFVTRFKRNAAIAIKAQREVAPEGIILADETVHLTNKSPGGQRKNRYALRDLRRITVRREDNEKPLILVTNDFKRSAEAIADLYRQRWQIELLFKWMKQKLKLKTYFGSSENAVKIQIYVAIISYLLLNRLKTATNSPNSLSNFLTELKATLFQRPRLIESAYRRRREREKYIAQQQRSFDLCF